MESISVAVFSQLDNVLDEPNIDDEIDASIFPIAPNDWPRNSPSFDVTFDHSNEPYGLVIFPFLSV